MEENMQAQQEATETDSIGGANNGSKQRIPVKFSFLEKFNTIALRILVIDDKIGKKGDNEVIKDFDESTNTIEIKDCDINKCTGCPRHNKDENCKLHVIKKLMNYQINQYNYFHYWNQVGIKTYYCPTVIEDFIDNDDGSNLKREINVYSAYHATEETDINIREKKEAEEEQKRRKENAVNIKCDFAPKIKKDDLHVQIVGVRDVRTALLLMSKFKFDMIFCDYLLDKKAGGSDERDYIKQLFDFLSDDYKDKIQNEHDTSKKKRLEVLEQLRHDVLDNRGPLDKLWIMPITGFNQTFIQDLYRNQIDLIGHKWNISNGADPITTPWQFLYHLNKLIELQLKSCVYRMDHLLRFVKYTCVDLQDLKDKKEKKTGNKKELGFFEFQSFMGSEYANFMRRYGNRHLIQRDAVGANDDDVDNKSVFATYVWNHFYANPEYRDVIELNRLIRRFLHHASVMHNDGNGQQRLEETFGQLSFFIDTNKEVQDTIKDFEDLKGLDEKMMCLRKIIDRVTDHSDNKKNQEKNTQ